MKYFVLGALASGMLPIALGEATKTVPYVMDGRKIYEFTVRWGEERTTDDLEGDISATSDKRPGKDDILQLLAKYTGIIEQTPPQFSAIKVDGNRAYDLAREGENLDRVIDGVRVQPEPRLPGPLEEGVIQGAAIHDQCLGAEPARQLPGRGFPPIADDQAAPGARVGRTQLLQRL